MQPHHFKKLSIVVPLCPAFALGIALQSVMPFARPTQAQGIVVDGRATRSEPAARAVPAGTFARLIYQGRLSNSIGAPINVTVNVTFTLYDSASVPVWTSATRTVTPTNGLFTVFLGDGADPNLDGNMLSQAASLGVTVGGDAEMTPRQALNSVVGHSDDSAGVVGSSSSWYGVIGRSNTGTK